MASRAEWAKRVDRWQKSGLSARDFAARERLDHRRLFWWRWHLRSTSTPSPASSMGFLPVHVVQASPAIDAARSPIEIALPNGRIVRVAPGFDADTLGRILAIASEREPC